MEKDNEIKLFTTSRDHLVDLAKKLADGIEPQFLKDKNQRVSIAIDGSRNGGKSIFPDTMWHRMFNDWNKRITSTTPDNREFNIWHNKIDGKKVMFGFVNVAYGRHKQALGQPKNKNLGGIEFLHNVNFASNRLPKPSIEIWTENGTEAFTKEPLRIPKQEQAVQQAYAELKSGDHERVDYVEIKVNDERLLKSQQFREMWQEMAKIGEQITSPQAKPAARKPSPTP